MDFKDPQVQKSIIVGILLVILGYVYFFTSFLPFFYQPTKARIESLSSDYEKMSAELEKARKTVGNLAKLEQECQRLHEKWIAAQSLLPMEEEVAKLLRKVTRAGNQSGVDFLLFEPQDPVAKEFYNENPVKVKVQGQYHQLGVFLSKVANLDRIINVTNLHVKQLEDRSKGKKGKTGKISKSYTVEAEMIMKAYTLLEGGEEADETTNESTS
jgi:type IV pilus assembly protein PilO